MADIALAIFLASPALLVFGYIIAGIVIARETKRKARDEAEQNRTDQLGTLLTGHYGALGLITACAVVRRTHSAGRHPGGRGATGGVSREGASHGCLLLGCSDRGCTP